MNLKITPVAFELILSFRDLYRQELDCQIVHDSAHYRENCFQSYLLEAGEQILGYGSIWTGGYWMEKGSVFEFYILPDHQPQLLKLFEQFIAATLPPKIYAQTNDPFLGTLIYSHAREITGRSILFKDNQTSSHPANGAIFRQTAPADREHIFKHHVEPVGDWLLEKNGRIIATGGVLYHYNRPYGDIFMEVDEPFRRQGYGCFLVQELKKICRQSGSVPSARTSPGNTASARTLARAGFIPCGRLIQGDTVFPGKNEESIPTMANPESAFSLPAKSGVNPDAGGETRPAGYPTDIYFKLRPTTLLESCTCGEISGLLLLYLFSSNPIQCLACKKEVDPARLQLTVEEVEDTARWMNVKSALDHLWLDSDEYETYAKEKLSDPSGQVNRDGMALAKKLSKRLPTYYWWFHDANDEDPVHCPNCSQPLDPAVNHGTGKCDACRIVI